MAAGNTRHYLLRSVRTSAERTCPLTCICFFFQAEDGIRDIGVTGVQTCALPIWAARPLARSAAALGHNRVPFERCTSGWPQATQNRSLATVAAPQLGQCIEGLQL